MNKKDELGRAAPLVHSHIISIRAHIRWALVSGFACVAALGDQYPANLSRTPTACCGPHCTKFAL